MTAEEFRKKWGPNLPQTPTFTSWTADLTALLETVRGEEREACCAALCPLCAQGKPAERVTYESAFGGVRTRWVHPGRGGEDARVCAAGTVREAGWKEKKGTNDAS